MKKLLLIILFFMNQYVSKAQIGVGHDNVNSNSTLDARSGSSLDKGIVLPLATSTSPFVSPFKAGSILYDSDNSLIYYTTDNAGNFNAISAWTFNVNSKNLHFPKNPSGPGYVGIGSNDNFSKLTISNGTDINTINSDDGYLFLGDNSSFMKFDADEISVYDPSNSNTFHLQRLGGMVTLGDNSQPSTQANIDVSGRIKENGADLIAPGTIVMYYESSVPAGWGLCDGTAYAKTDGTGSIKSPDLQNKFVVSTGTTYPIDDEGGENEHILTLNEIPSHNHDVKVNSSDGNHNHSVGTSSLLVGGTPAPFGSTSYIDGADGSTDDRNIKDQGEGKHTHGVNQNNSPNITTNSKHENRPLFYALVYMIKL